MHIITWYETTFNEDTFPFPPTRGAAYAWAAGGVLDTTPTQCTLLGRGMELLRVCNGVGVWQFEGEGEYHFSDGVPDGATETDPVADVDDSETLAHTRRMCEFVSELESMLDDAAALGMTDMCAQLASMCRRLAEASDRRADAVSYRVNGGIQGAMACETDSEQFLDDARKAQCPS